MELEGSLPCSEVSAYGPYPKSDVSSPQLAILFPQDIF